MTDTDKLEKLRIILKKQIDWYEENKADESYVYDQLYDVFNDLRRGDFIKIVELLNSK